MKKSLSISLIFMIAILALSSFKTSAGNLANQRTIVLIKQSKWFDEMPDVEGHRAPTQRISARISLSEGMVIPGVDKSEILGYYALDEQGNLLGEFHNNHEFASFVFSLKGTIEIRIELEDYWLCGYLNC